MIICKSCFEYGGKQVGGYFYIPYQGGKFPAVILVHGFGGGVHERRNVLLCEKLAQAGIVAFMFDFYDKPNGVSELPVLDMTVSLQLQVLRHAVDFVMAQSFVDMRRVGITGHSLGGMTVLLYGATDERLKGIVVQAAVSEVREDSGVAHWEEWERKGRYTFGPEFSGISVKWDFITDAKKYDVYASCEKIKCPVLVLHGDNDVLVPLEQAQQQLQHLKQSDTLVVLKGADHCLYPLASLFTATGLIVDFMIENLGVAVRKQLAEPIEEGESTHEEE